ncbi:hypothetical protein R6U77_08035 [Lysinibacillus louembei]|uniref:Uncharacterized protein n=1 Tax=Lysinibacillus louembei TaxID=1470088 RepID=A0ABZ0RZM3_9BACI|nr:hypothetical protein [Lysinibacillus louembei]WPK13605.1 hypothetical protein R6U77_08035 [Lysinibacillus louembei]
MRTSRVSATHNNMFRDSRHYVQASDAFQQVMDGDNRPPFNQSNQQALLQNNNKQKKKKSIILKNSPRLIIKGMQYNADSAIIRNRLLVASQVVNYTSNIKSRHYTYRNSI